MNLVHVHLILSFFVSIIVEYNERAKGIIEKISFIESEWLLLYLYIPLYGIFSKYGYTFWEGLIYITIHYLLYHVLRYNLKQY